VCLDFPQQKKESGFSSAPFILYNFTCLVCDNFQGIPPSLASSVNAKGIQECVDVIHRGHAVATPQSFKLAIADSRHNCLIAFQLNVAVVFLDYLCLTIKGLPAVCGFQLIDSFHDVDFLSLLVCCWVFAFLEYNISYNNIVVK